MSRFSTTMCPIVTSAASVQNMNASSVEVAHVYLAHKSGSISEVTFNTLLVGTSPVYELTIEEVSNYRPNGTLINAGASNTFSVSSSSVQTVTLTTPATVTRGQLYAVRIKYSSGTIDGSNYIRIYHSHAGVNTANGVRDIPCPYISVNSGASWSSGADIFPASAPIYSDGAAEDYSFCFSSSVSRSFGTATTYTHVGARFTAPSTCDVIGGNYAFGQTSASVSRTLMLLDTSDNVLASVVQDGYGLVGSNNGYVYFTTAYQVTAGIEYRLVFEAGSSSALGITNYEYPSSEIRDACHPDCYTTLKSGGSWSDEPTFAPFVVPVFANFQSGGGGGASLPLIGGGGLVY